MPTDEDQKHKEAQDKLAALKTTRAKKSLEREESTKTAEVLRQVALEEKRLANDEVYAKLEDQYGTGNIKSFTLKDGTMVVVKAPESMAFRRFTDHVALADHPNPKVRKSMHDSALQMAQLCVVHPDRVTFDALAERWPGLVPTAAGEAYELGKPQVEEDAGK